MTPEQLCEIYADLLQHVEKLPINGNTVGNYSSTPTDTLKTRREKYLQELRRYNPCDNEKFALGFVGNVHAVSMLRDLLKQMENANHLTPKALAVLESLADFAHYL